MVRKRDNIHEVEAVRRKLLPSPCRVCGSLGWVEHSVVTCGFSYYAKKSRFAIGQRVAEKNGPGRGVVTFFDPGYKGCENIYHVLIDGRDRCTAVFESTMKSLDE